MCERFRNRCAFRDVRLPYGRFALRNTLRRADVRGAHGARAASMANTDHIRRNQMTSVKLNVAVSVALLTLGFIANAQAQASDMTFFVTSTGSGKGADFGGLAGADKHCQALASAAGAGSRTWHAYLSAAPAQGSSAVNARDRIGSGPWKNAKGVVIAQNVAELHGANN